MNNLILIMCLMGSTLYIVYRLLCVIFHQRISPKCRLTLLCFTMAFYLLPFPLLANAYRVFINDTISLLGFNPISSLRDRELEIVEEKVIFISAAGKLKLPSYDVLIRFVFLAWGVIAIFYLSKQFYLYHKMKVYWMATTVSAPTENNEIESGDSKTRNYSIRYFDGERSAFTLGFVHPVIFIPKSISENDKKWIVRHEEHHVYHFDTMIKFFGLLVILLHWYCPVSWFCFRSLELTLELLCDEKTLKNSSEEDKRDYINLLLSHAGNSKNPNILCQSFQGNRYKMTKERVLMIKNNNKRHFLLALIATVVSVFIGFTPVLAYQIPEVKDVAAYGVSDFPESGIECVFFEENEDPLSEYKTPSLAESDIVFRETDSYIVFEDGSIILLPSNSARSSIFCSHSYKNGTRKTHAKMTDGSCKIMIYDVYACCKCGYIKTQEFVSSHTWAKCPHE